MAKGLDPREGSVAQSLLHDVACIDGSEGAESEDDSRGVRWQKRRRMCELATTRIAKNGCACGSRQRKRCSWAARAISLLLPAIPFVLVLVSFSKLLEARETERDLMSDCYSRYEIYECAQARPWIRAIVHGEKPVNAVTHRFQSSRRLVTAGCMHMMPADTSGTDTWDRHTIVSRSEFMDHSVVYGRVTDVPDWAYECPPPRCQWCNPFIPYDPDNLLCRCFMELTTQRCLNGDYRNLGEHGREQRVRSLSKAGRTLCIVSACLLLPLALIAYCVNKMLATYAPTPQENCVEDRAGTSPHSHPHADVWMLKVGGFTLLELQRHRPHRPHHRPPPPPPHGGHGPPPHRGHGPPPDHPPPHGRRSPPPGHFPPPRHHTAASTTP